ncbi:MAG: putative dsRNA-binding protein, partial [Magnetococcus sp. WYHC-3]
NKMAAERAAASELLERLPQVATVALPGSLVPQANPARSAKRGGIDLDRWKKLAQSDPISALGSLCAQLEWSIPEYEHSEAGPPFTCICTVEGTGREAITDQATGENRQRAKRLAARAVFDRIF